MRYTHTCIYAHSFVCFCAQASKKSACRIAVCCIFSILRLTVSKIIFRADCPGSSCFAIAFQLGTIYMFTSFHVINPRNVTSPVKNDGWKWKSTFLFGFRPIFRGQTVKNNESARWIPKHELFVGRAMPLPNGKASSSSGPMPRWSGSHWKLGDLIPPNQPFSMCWMGEWRQLKVLVCKLACWGAY